MKHPRDIGGWDNDTIRRPPVGGTAEIMLPKPDIAPFFLCCCRYVVLAQFHGSQMYESIKKIRRPDGMRQKKFPGNRGIALEYFESCPSEKSARQRNLRLQ